MSSLDDTGEIVVDSLNIVNEVNSASSCEEKPITTKDLNGIYNMLENLDRKLNKISDVEKRLVKIEGLVSRMDNLDEIIAKAAQKLSRMTVS